MINKINKHLKDCGNCLECELYIGVTGGLYIEHECMFELHSSLWDWDAIHRVLNVQENT